jgi:two-component system sensor histidine kinase/response regulator
MLTGLHLLLVEDTPINAEVAGEILRRAGASYDLAIDGLQAIEAVRCVAYAIVLMDCQLPRLDGYEATRRIRALEAARGYEGPPRPGRVPILALTACSAPADHERARLAGMDALIAKPVDAQRLLSAIGRHTSR